MNDFYSYDEEYRNTIATVDEKGKRIWIYPKKPRGEFHNLRIVVAIVLLGLLFAGPFIRSGGQPFMLFNVFERKFIIMGIPLWPQDFHIVALAMISFVVFIVLFTVVFGRVWCGWACPQTIFMEMVFRKIEYWIEGDATRQRKLDQAPWTAEKVRKKLLKHAIFVLIALLISHTVMAYLIGVDQVIEIIRQPPAAHLAGFIGLMVFTGIFYFIFAHFREQACIVVCPYGRLQGVFLGNNSIGVMYDWKRGEPRGRLKKDVVQEGDRGDCIDCKMCVYACPTGIDIRNGTQLECVNCTACIDACDDIMVRTQKPKGLIRYASFSGIRDGVQRIFTARVAGYSLVLAALITLVFTLLLSRTPIEATVLKVPGQLYQEQPGDRISNLYNIQFINKTFEPVELELKLRDRDDALIRRVGEEALSIPAGARIDGVFFIEMPKSSIVQMNTPLVLQLWSGGELMDEMKTNFIGPAARRP
jgi:cytochrome c oxidase accessory protein FixG